MVPPMTSEPGEFDTSTVVFLFTDIEGSTRLWQEQPVAMKEALARHHELLREAISGQGGSVFLVVGDGFCAAFGTTQAAVAAAVAAQRALSVEPWGPTGPLRVRMAVHAGPAAVGREDVAAGEYASGPTLNHAARLLAAGHGGQVLLSSAARGLVGSALPEGIGLRDLGTYRLRDLPDPERIYQLTAPGLRERFPPLRGADLRRGNLPAPLTSFIGRERELAELAQILDDTRLLTLTGSGGTGKTRLALELARELESRFPDGAWLVELAAVIDPTLVVQVVSTALGLREQPGRPLLTTLKDYLAMAQLVLLLDNCEHLLDTCALLVGDLLRASPGLRVLATSREPLAVPGEVTYRVASLSLPDSRQPDAEADLMTYEAVRLFVERAQAAQPGFRLSSTNAAAIVRICHRVDGIPLAIELAATRLRTLSADQIAARLDDYFGLLTGGSRSALPRQQTLRALIDWSHDLLSEPEKLLLRRLSVFSSGWTLEAVEAVGKADSKPDAGHPGSEGLDTAPWALEVGVQGEYGPGSEIDVLETLGRLVDRSLVIAETPDVEDGDTMLDRAGETRYRLLEMIRQYAREKLLASGEAAAVRDRHLAFFAALASDCELALHGPSQAGWLIRLDAELDNLRSAMAWARVSQPIVALNTAAHLREYWTRRGLATEGRRWLGETLQLVEQMPDPTGALRVEWILSRARGRTALATLMLAQGEYQNAYQAAQQGVALARETGVQRDLILPLTWFALVAGLSGHSPEARAAADEMMALPKGPLDAVWTGMTLSTLAGLAVNVDGDFAKARDYLLESREHVRKLGDSWAEAMSAWNLGELAYRQRHYPDAEARYHESLMLWESVGDRIYMQLPTSGLADVARQTGDYDRAVTLYRQLVNGWQRAGNVGAIARCLECLAFIAVARGQIGREHQGLSQHAAHLLGAAETLREESGAPMTPEERAEYDQIVNALVEQTKGSFGTEFNAAWSEGRAMTRAQAVEYALHDGGVTDAA
jgi:predicted ATPase/class 3 adenylate cyclase